MPELKRPGLLLKTVLFAIPALLFLPVFYYSLTTPFALIDDYGDWRHIKIPKVVAIPR